jgi:hypothetical protein
MRFRVEAIKTEREKQQQTEVVPVEDSFPEREPAPPGPSSPLGPSSPPNPAAPAADEKPRLDSLQLSLSFSNYAPTPAPSPFSSQPPSHLAALLPADADLRNGSDTAELRPYEPYFPVAELYDDGGDEILRPNLAAVSSPHRTLAEHQAPYIGPVLLFLITELCCDFPY